MFLSDVRLPVHRFECGGRRLVVIGSKQNLTHLIKVFCGEVLAGELIETIWGWQANRCAERHTGDCDLLAINVSAGWAGDWSERRWAMPQLINQAIVLPEHERDVMPLIRNERTTAELNKLHDFGYIYAVTRERDKFELFYHEFYAPHISQRHGDTAWVMPFEPWVRSCEGCDLLLVSRDGREVSGAVNRSDGVRTRMEYIGVRHADADLLQQGAAGAVYYYSILEAQRAGCALFDLGRALPFLNDGVLYFKKKWGTRLTPDSDIERQLWLEFREMSEPVARLLAESPLILFRKGGDDQNELIGMVRLYAEQFSKEKDLRSWLKRISDAGLSELRVLLDGGGWEARGELLRDIAKHLICPVRYLRVGGTPSTEQLLIWPDWDFPAAHERFAPRLRERSEVKPGIEGGVVLAEG